MKSEGRFYDLIMHDKDVPDIMKDGIDGVTVLSCNNVGIYYWQECDKEIWTLRDFPNVAPPFERFWLDFTAPSFVNSEEYGIIPWNEESASHWGFDCWGFDLRQEETRTYYLSTYDGFENPLYPYMDTARWAMDMYMYWRFQGRIRQPWLWRTLVDDQGKFVCNKDGKEVLLNAPTNDETDFALEQLAQVMPYEKAFENMQRFVLPYWHTAALAISFLHCKNVVLEEVKPPRKVVHNKSQKRRGVKPYLPVPYKVLVIEPMKRILKSEGQSEQVGAKKSLHICIGHFKHYENGRGLFGKHKGTYWFPQQIRGSKGKGITTKDYEIKL